MREAVDAAFDVVPGRREERRMGTAALAACDVVPGDLRITTPHLFRRALRCYTTPKSSGASTRGAPHMSFNDPKQGREVGEQPYEDATQGIEIGERPGEDPTQQA